MYDTLAQHDSTEQATHYFGKARSWSLAGILTGSIMGGIVAEQIGLNWPMILSAIPLAFSAIIAWGLPEPARSKQDISDSTRYLEYIKAGFISLQRNRSLQVLLFNILGVSTAAYFVIWFYQPLLTQSGIPISWFGFFHAGLVLVELIIASQFRAITKFLGSKSRFITMPALITAISFFAVAAAPNLISIIGFMIFAGGCGLTRLDYISPLTHKFIHSHQRASAASSLSMFRRFGQAIANPIIGGLADRSLTGALFLTGLIPLFSVALHRKTKSILEN